MKAEAFDMLAMLGTLWDRDGVDPREDPDKVLEICEATVSWSDELFDVDGHPARNKYPVWSLVWKFGVMGFPGSWNEHQARAAAAMFCYLWLHKIDPGVAGTLSEMWGGRR